MVSGIRGSYVVKEEGLVYEHTTTIGKKNTNTNIDDDDQPTTPAVFLERFKSNFRVRVLERLDANHVVYEMINIDVSLVNALRRILLSEIPTVALEHIYMWTNNSIIHDEVLSHRLGLIPLNIDARLLDDIDMAVMMGEDGGGTTTNNNAVAEEEPTPTDRNTVVFRLAASCPADPKKSNKKKDDKQLKKQQQRTKSSQSGNIKQEEDADEGDSYNLGTTGVSVDDMQMMQEEEKISVVDSTSVSMTEEAKFAVAAATAGKLQYPKDRPYTLHVYSKDLVWCPQGEQMELFRQVAVAAGVPDDDDAAIAQYLPRPIHDDILIAKLRPGQSIELEAHGQRGIGKDHAKYSPVATASYRMMPQIEIIKPIYDDHAKELVYVYEPGVFELVPTDPTSGEDAPGTTVKAVVCNPYACTMSRNYMRNPLLKESIIMKRTPDHFIFSIESVGMYSPSVLLAEAVRTMQRKCQSVQDSIEEHNLQNDIL